MPKMYSLRTILRGEETIAKHTVFDATVDDAKSLDALNSARPATADEIKAAKDTANKADGIQSDDQPAAVVEDAAKPASNAPGDPQNSVKAAKPAL